MYIFGVLLILLMYRQFHVYVFQLPLEICGRYWPLLYVQHYNKYMLVYVSIVYMVCPRKAKSLAISRFLFFKYMFMLMARTKKSHWTVSIFIVEKNVRISEETFVCLSDDSHSIEEREKKLVPIKNQRRNITSNGHWLYELYACLATWLLACLTTDFRFVVMKC